MDVTPALLPNGEVGVPVTEIAALTGMTTRTVYRDIRALEEELDVPVFQAGRAVRRRHQSATSGRRRPGRSSSKRTT